jgi:putative transposase
VKFKGREDVQELCKWAGVWKSTFHYKEHPGKRGMVASTHTPKGEQLVENKEVVDEVRRILGEQDYCVYGYHMMTTELRGLGYLINPKKVYRLMDENHLLCGKKIKTHGKREFVKFRRINATKPMEYLCLDIKHVWVQGEGCRYYQLAIMDVFSRRILCYIFQKNIKQKDVIRLMRGLDLKFGLKGVIIRNDNGSQFIAHAVRQTLRDLEAKQEFTHVATPEENAYIESFHSIQQRELMDRFEFTSFYHAQWHIERYMYWYNYIRRHGSLKGMTPMEKWAQGMNSFPLRRSMQQELNHLSVSYGSYENWVQNQSSSFELEDYQKVKYIYLNSEQKKEDLVINLFEKNVQLIGG